MIAGQITSPIQWVPPVNVRQEDLASGPALIRAVKVESRGGFVLVPIVSIPELIGVLRSYLPEAQR